MLLSLDHIQLAMPAGQEAKARAFYSELLGLREVEKPRPLRARGGCWFEGAGFGLHLGVEIDFHPAKKAHPAFQVEGLETLHLRLRQAGAEPTWDAALPNVQRFYASDPFGNRLEFMARH